MRRRWPPPYLWEDERNAPPSRAMARCGHLSCVEVDDLALIDGIFLCWLHRAGLTRALTMEPMSAVPRCRCGEPATANGRECGACFRDRLCSVHNGYTPTRTVGAGQVDPAKTRRWDSRLEDYRKVRHEGSQPAGTKRRQIDAAKRRSDEAQAAFRADRTNLEREVA